MITSYQQQYENYISFISQSKSNLISEIKQAFYDIIEDTSLNKNLGTIYNELISIILNGPHAIDYSIKENQIKAIVNLVMLNRFDTVTLKDVYKNNSMFNYSILSKIFIEEYRGIVSIEQVEIQEKSLEELQKLSSKLKILNTKFIDKETSSYYITENKEAILVYDEDKYKLTIYTPSITLIPGNALIAYEAPYQQLADMIGKRFNSILKNIQENTLENYQIPIKIKSKTDGKEVEFNSEEIYSIYRNLEAEKVKAVSQLNKIMAENYSGLNINNLFFKMICLYKIPNEKSEEFIQKATGVSKFNTLEIIENKDMVRKHWAKELILSGNKEDYFVEPYKFDKNSKISERNCKLYVSNIEFSTDVQWAYTTNFSYDIKTLNGLTFRFANGETLVNVGTQHQIDEFSKKRHKLVMKYTREIERLIRELDIPQETLESWISEFKKLKVRK